MPSSPTPTNVSCCQPKSFFPSFQLQQHLDQSCSHGPKVELLLGLLPLQFSSVAQSCPTPCDPMNCSTLGLLIHYQLLEFTQTHVLVMPSNHLVLCRPFSSCPQSFPESGSFQMSQLFTSGGQSIGVSASTLVLPMNTRTDLL